MLIVGSKGFAKQLLHSLSRVEWEKLALFDNINLEQNVLFDKFSILHSESETKNYFETVDSRFTLGVGGPAVRARLASLLRSWGGVLSTTIADGAEISPWGVTLEDGINILSGVQVEPGVTIREGSLINLNVAITHDSYIGPFTEIGPGANLLGECSIGEGCFIGAGAIVLPKIKIGDRAIVGAGAVITKDVPARSTMVGVPARQK